MSYTALYRKYRPSTFDDVAGQQHIVTTLTNALNQNRLAHAYLFSGPSGNGKTSIAKLFAKAINCESETELICDKCANCLATKNNTHPDVVEIDAASNNGVDEIRNLIEKVKYSPIEGRYKIYIIDEVHMLSLGAFNALLKTLEEPPAHVVFILATTEPHKVIPTIISRCQRYDFSRVKEEDIYNNITKILKLENIKYEPSAISLISNLADGGVRESLSILEQSVAYAIDEIKVDDVRRIYGIVTKEEKLQLLLNIFNQNMEETLHNLETISDQGNNLERLNLDLINILKESVIYAYAKSSELLNILTVNEVKEILSLLSSKQLLEMIDILMEIDSAKKNISDLHAYLELGFIKMINIAERNVNNEVKISKTAEKTIEQPNIVKDEKIEKLVEEKKVEKQIEIKEEIIVDKKVEKVENLKEEIILPQVNELDDEMLLSLLTFASKEKRIAIEDKWQLIINHCTDVNYAKYAYKLINTNLLAVGEEYALIVVESEMAAADLNSLDNQKGLVKFLIDKLDETLQIFAITKDKSNELILEFKKRAANKSLPTNLNLEPIKFDDEVKVKDDLISKAENLFGVDGFIIEE